MPLIKWSGNFAVYSNADPTPLRARGGRPINHPNKPPKEITMIYEHRHYSCIPGRLPALLKRFETQTLSMWKKHAINQVGFWTVLIGDGNHDLHYILAWDSLADREKKWNAFQADPEWHKARADSEKDGAILANVKSTMWQPTAFSAIK
jgi:hypothetical protein